MSKDWPHLKGRKGQRNGDWSDDVEEETYEGEGGEVILVRLLQSNQHCEHKSAHKRAYKSICNIWIARCPGLTGTFNLCTVQVFNQFILLLCSTVQHVHQVQCTVKVNHVKVNKLENVQFSESCPVYSVSFTSSDKAALHLVRRSSSNKRGSQQGTKSSSLASFGEGECSAVQGGKV